MSEHIKELVIEGYKVGHDLRQGHLWVEHDGQITWDELQRIKNKVWGRWARAIEAYPAEDAVVNNGNFRHLWLLGARDFCPDLLGRMPKSATLESRCRQAWAEAQS